MGLRVKRLCPDAKVPSRARSGDSGLDACALLGIKGSSIVIGPGEARSIPLGIAIEVPPGFEVQVRPRSGLTKQGIHCAFGTVDSGFRGELRAILENRSKQAFAIHDGDRVCQLVISRVELWEPQVVEELSDSERGAQGWGSTGVRP